MDAWLGKLSNFAHIVIGKLNYEIETNKDLWELGIPLGINSIPSDVGLRRARRVTHPSGVANKINREVNEMLDMDKIHSNMSDYELLKIDTHELLHTREILRGQRADYIDRADDGGRDARGYEISAGKVSRQIEVLSRLIKRRGELIDAKYAAEADTTASQSKRVPFASVNYME